MSPGMKMPYKKRPIFPHGAPGFVYLPKQRGVVLFVALIVLVAMSLAGVSLMRAADTGTQIAGNLAQRQSTIPAADKAFERALKQVVDMTVAGTSRSNNPYNGYSATEIEQEVAKRNWAASWNLGVDASTGNEVRIMIDRLCDALQNCQSTKGDAVKAEGQSKTCGSEACKVRPPFVHFRAVSQVTDPKGMTTYIEQKID
jgi:type IV pilus assembly protein PilX